MIGFSSEFSNLRQATTLKSLINETDKEIWHVPKELCIDSNYGYQVLQWAIWYLFWTKTCNFIQKKALLDGRSNQTSSDDGADLSSHSHRGQVESAE